MNKKYFFLIKSKHVREIVKGKLSMSKNKKTFSLGTDIAYGGLKKDLIGFLRGFYRYNPFNNGYINMSTGRNYELVFANDSYINILRRSNFYKKVKTLTV